MGADPLAHAIAIVAGIEWFSVRKTPKGRGTNRRVEGADLGRGRSVLVVEDVVTTGSSMLEAIEAVRETGATVAAAAVIVDRGDRARPLFARRRRSLRRPAHVRRPGDPRRRLGVAQLQPGVCLSIRATARSVSSCRKKWPPSIQVTSTPACSAWWRKTLWGSGVVVPARTVTEAVCRGRCS